MTGDISMALYIAAIGLTFGLFIVFIMQMVFNHDNENNSDDEF